MPPAFTILTPTFQCGRYVERCWWALRQQRWTDWEWVVVDDGSTDETAARLTAIVAEARGQLRVVRHESNRGRGAARMAGLAAARGRWVVAWDMDDLGFPDRLDRLAEALGEGAEFAVSRMAVVDVRGRLKGIRGFSEYPGVGRIFAGATLAAPLERVKGIGYPTDERVGEDKRVIFALAARAERGVYIEEPLYIYEEGREMGPAKALADAAAEERALSRLVGEGRIAQSEASRAQVAAICRRLRRKRNVLWLLRACPALYRLSVRRRTLGDGAGVTLATERARWLQDVWLRNCAAAREGATLEGGRE